MLHAALRWTRRFLEPRWEMFPRGHYYSPLPDLADLEKRSDTIFSKDVDLSDSIDLRVEDQLALIRRIGELKADFDWPSEQATDRRYYLPNRWFEAGDALALFGILRLFKPKRVIEVGSGFSSALMLDVNERFMDRSLQFTFIEPYPERLLGRLKPEDHPQVTILEKPVQSVPLEQFRQLESGDILFIDSSHVSKAGSDLNYLLFEVLPVLPAGCFVHFHDIFWPFEYPKQWITEGRSWNEAYLLRAFLQYNDRFEIVLFNSYLGDKHRDVLEKVLPRFLADTGGSIWLRKR